MLIYFCEYFLHLVNWFVCFSFGFFSLLGCVRNFQFVYTVYVSNILFEQRRIFLLPPLSIHIVMKIILNIVCLKITVYLESFKLQGVLFDASNLTSPNRVRAKIKTVWTMAAHQISMKKAFGWRCPDDLSGRLANCRLYQNTFARLVNKPLKYMTNFHLKRHQQNHNTFPQAFVNLYQK